MKMSKIEGLDMLKMLNFPTVEQIDPNLLDENSQVLKQGLSVRTSPKKDMVYNTNLPSIHNCTNLNELRSFIQDHKSEYHTIVHKTVEAEIIGSISRFEAGTDKLSIETYEDFGKRKKEIIKNRVTVPIMGEKFAVSQLEMQEENPEDFKLFSQVIRDVKYLPFKKYDAEFIVKDGKVVFTDLTIQGREDSQYAEELKKRFEQKNEAPSKDGK